MPVHLAKIVVVGVIAMNKNFNSEEIENATSAISLLINDCLGNLNEEQLLEVKESHRMLMEQQIFWIFQKDYDRFLYELRDYGNWLCNYIADAERELFE